MKIHISCHEPLWLGDHFGSIELMEFTTPELGIVSSYEYVILDVNVHFPSSDDGNEEEDAAATSTTASTSTTRAITKNTILKDISITNLSDDSINNLTPHYNNIMNFGFPNDLLGSEISNHDGHDVTIDFPVTFFIDLSTIQTYRISIKVVAEETITISGTNNTTEEAEEVSIVRRYEGEEIYEFTTGFPPRPYD